MVLAFDCTYLTTTLTQLCLHGQKGMVGGQWLPDQVSNSFINLSEESVNIKSICKASTMLELLAWDPTMQLKRPLSVLSLPIPHAFGGTHATNRGNFFMLNVIGQAMLASNGVVRALVFDGAGTHQYIRKVLHGQISGLNLDDLKQVPWFNELKWEALPQTCLPRCPIEICKWRGEHVTALPGICALS